MNKLVRESLDNLNDYASKIQNYLDDNEFNELDLNSLLKEYGLTVDDLTETASNTTRKMPLPFVKLTEEATSPKYNYPTDSGFDLHSVVDIEIPAFGRALVPTGLCFDIKDGYEIQVRSKSGLAINQGLMCLNSPGTVDNGYTGEIKVILFNTNNHPVTISKGMKIAQAVLCPVVNGKWVDLVLTQEIKNKDRNSNGFGSTGI